LVEVSNEKEELEEDCMMIGFGNYLILHGFILLSLSHELIEEYENEEEEEKSQLLLSPNFPSDCSSLSSHLFEEDFDQMIGRLDVRNILF